MAKKTGITTTAHPADRRSPYREPETYKYLAES
jgi:hypothetical protein